MPTVQVRARKLERRIVDIVEGLKLGNVLPDERTVLGVTEGGLLQGRIEVLDVLELAQLDIMAMIERPCRQEVCSDRAGEEGMTAS